MVDLLERPGGMVPTDDARRHLVVIGNGMAGARAVEEILARGGAEQFVITMFGDEPYGNYNRIMLSHVLSGEETDDGIYPQLPGVVRGERDHPACRRPGPQDRPVREVDLRRGRVGHSVRRGHHRHGQPLVHAQDGGSVPRTFDGSALLPGVFGFRSLDDTRAMIEHAEHEHHHKAVVIGGGLLGLEAARGLQRFGLDVTVVHSPGHLMNAQLSAPGGDMLKRSVEQLGITVLTGGPHHRRDRHRQGHRRSARGTSATCSATSWSSPPASGPTPTWP